MPSSLPTSTGFSETPMQDDDVPYWWYMDVEEKEQGPVSKKQLYQAWQAHALDNSCYVWNKSMKEWAQINTLEDLYTYLRTPQIITPTPTSTTILITTPQSTNFASIPLLNPTPTPQSSPLPLAIPPQSATSVGMMPATRVVMEPLAISPPQKKSWFSNWSSRYQSGDNRKRLIDPGSDSDSEARKELEIEQYNATKVHVIYTAVWLLSTAGLVFALGILGQGWFQVFGYMTIGYNIVTYFLVWYDRILEMRRSNTRISEWIIFLYVWWAGFVGAWLAFCCFNHKFQSVPFTAKAIACTILNLFWIAIYVNSLGLDSSDDDGGGD